MCLELDAVERERLQSFTDEAWRKAMSEHAGTIPDAKADWKPEQINEQAKYEPRTLVAKMSVEDAKGLLSDMREALQPIVANGHHPDRSPSIAKLSLALAKAQLAYKPLTKNLTNPYYGSKYADLAAVIEATQEALAKNELALIQLPVVRPEDKKAGVRTVLSHSSGEYIENELLLPAEMKARDGSMRFDAQSAGSAFSYSRRYAYQAMVGIAADIDDDAEKAVGHGSVDAAKQVAKQKVDALKGDVVPMMFFRFDTNDPEQAFYVTGDKTLMNANKELLLYKGKIQPDKSVKFTPNDFEDLKHECGERGITLKQNK